VSALIRWLVIWPLRIAALVLILGPLVVVIAMSFSPDSSGQLRASGLTWRWYANVFNVSSLYGSLIVSLKIAGIVVPLSLIVGTAAAYAQWRVRFLPSRVMETILSLPILVPLVVTGLALLHAYNSVGMHSAFVNIVLAHLVLTFPFTVRFVLNALSRYDAALDEAAQNLGARPLQVFRHVTFPLLRPALFASALFSFVVSFDDFGVTIFLIDAKTLTLPIAMYQYLEWNIDPTLAALSSMLVATAVVVAVACERLIGLERFVGAQN
jgi:putative spermidine/putrescine transport system permease protein